MFAANILIKRTKRIFIHIWTIWREGVWCVLLFLRIFGNICIAEERMQLIHLVKLFLDKKNQHILSMFYVRVNFEIIPLYHTSKEKKEKLYWIGFSELESEENRRKNLEWKNRNYFELFILRVIFAPARIFLVNLLQFFRL